MRTESWRKKQLKVGPKGSASGAMQLKDCRMAAPKEKQVGKTCESNERLPARRGANESNAEMCLTKYKNVCHVIRKGAKLLIFQKLMLF